MTRDILADRQSAFEYQFFYTLDQRLLQDLATEQRAEKRRLRLKKVLGISDEEVLKELDNCGIRPETAHALTIYPLVRVAWANGDVTAAEREAILEAAKHESIQDESLANSLLEAWLDRPPGEELWEAWQHYIGALAKTMDAGTFELLHRSVTMRARGVARAAGGLLGLHRVSRAESQVLNELDWAFTSEQSETVPTVEP